MVSWRVLVILKFVLSLEVMPRFQASLEARGAWIHNGLKIVDHGDGERSMRTTQAIDGEETLVFMPWELAGTGAKGRETAMGQDASCLLDGANEEQYLAIWLLDLCVCNMDDDYLKTLPTEISHLPTCWSAEEKEILQGSQIGAGLAFRDMQDIEFCQALRERNEQFDNLLKKDPQAWTWAISMVRLVVSVFLTSEGDDEMKQYGMFPFCDFLNHQTFSNAKWTSSLESSALIISSRFCIEPDTEITISYGQHLEPTGSLLNYGFIPSVFGAETSAVIRFDGNELCPNKSSRKFNMWIRDDGRYGEQYPSRERGVQLSIGAESSAKTALSLARVAAADDDILDAFIDRYKARKLEYEKSEQAKRKIENEQVFHDQHDTDDSIICADVARDVMSMTNERQALEILLNVIDSQLAEKFPTSLREDLYEASHADSINARNAAKALASEKLVLYHWRCTFFRLQNCLDEYLDSFDAGIHYSLVLEDLLASSIRFVPTLIEALESPSSFMLTVDEEEEAVVLQQVTPSSS